MAFETVEWKDGKVVVLDQKLLPHKTKYHSYSEPEEVARSIQDMTLRGAPAIGVAAALGLALGAQKLAKTDLANARERFEEWARMFAQTRPTAVNLFWAIERMKGMSARSFDSAKSWADALLKEALLIREEDIAACKRMGELGNELVPPNARILTHCNAGALATAGWGTALGVIRSAAKAGKNISVWVDETRPFLQGARLTAWELKEEGIPATLISDNMAGHFMSRGEVDLVIVGADRIAANGDVANKIGTYTLAVLAHENRVPFFVAAPLSTLDFNTPTGKEIPIEERDPKEVAEFGGVRVAPDAVHARHPAFDVTPNRFITAIITEAGIAKPPYGESLRKFKKP
ncbi:MAG: S-methyl-5-thioribose-1-phosphate isomerase [Pseudomonadota bacterium]